jgi:hypothetical protein
MPDTSPIAGWLGDSRITCAGNMMPGASDTCRAGVGLPLPLKLSANSEKRPAEVNMRGSHLLVRYR